MELLTRINTTRDALFEQTGIVENAIKFGALKKHLDLFVSEALSPGKLRKGVRNYISMFGHGSTEIAEVLRIDQQTGLVNVHNVRNEIEDSPTAPHYGGSPERKPRLWHLSGWSVAGYRSVADGHNKWNRRLVLIR